MSISDYLNPKFFPHTTQLGLTIEKQMMIDAVNYDELMEAEQAGALLTPEEEEIARELKTKYSAMSTIAAEIVQSRKPNPPPPLSPLHQ